MRVRGLFFKLCFLQKTFNYIGIKLYHSMNPERSHVLLQSSSVTTQRCGLCFPKTLKIACQGKTLYSVLRKWSTDEHLSIGFIFQCLVCVNILSACFLDALDNWPRCILLLHQNPSEILWWYSRWFNVYIFILMVKAILEKRCSIS